jgi:phosphoribosyl 1,2-cyclic phosphate phosphodiesterase
MPYEGVETLVVNALRFDKPHHSHQLVDDAVAFARRVGARRTLLIHMCHDIGLHEKVNTMLPEGVELAFDGQVLNVAM